jgi:hypothetical protein
LPRVCPWRFELIARLSVSNAMGPATPRDFVSRTARQELTPFTVLDDMP